MRLWRPTWIREHRSITSILHLVLIAMLALFAAGGGVGASAVVPLGQTGSADQVGTEMGDCIDCSMEQMHSDMQPCGSTCVAPILAVLGDQEFQSASAPAAGFAVVDDHAAGQNRRPELTPPRLS